MCRGNIFADFRAMGKQQPSQATKNPNLDEIVGEYIYIHGFEANDMPPRNPEVGGTPQAFAIVHLISSSVRMKLHRINTAMERDVRQMIHYLKQDKECDQPFMIFFSQGESYYDAAVRSHTPRNRIICFVFASVQCDGWFSRAL